MPEYLVPGVFVEELAQLPPAVAEVDSALPAFVGYTAQAKRSKTGDLRRVAQRIRSLADFDNAYTAPLHGFANKDDYYRRAAAKPFLPDIATPTLLLNAQNDPFLPGRFLPTANEVSDSVYLLQPKNGGHVGFVSGSGRGHLRWMPQAVLSFFEWQNSR